MRISRKIRNYLTCFLLMSFSVVVCLIVLEFILRAAFYQVDYLQPYLVEDPILGNEVKPYSSGHDAWGYRNKFVPSSVDIVTIGDSLTYGVSAKAKDSWPSNLQQLTHKDVYNLSLGGYGPAEYLYLLENKALTMNPSLIIVGFYFGNDLADAYNAVYMRDQWKYLRKDGDVSKEIVYRENARHRFMHRYRDWLAHHSILYRMSIYSFGSMVQFLEIKYGYGQRDPDVTILEDEDLKIRTGFNPVARLTGLDLENRRIQEGLRLSLKFFSQMHEICSRKRVNLLIVLTPTKESVFSEFLNHNNKLRNSSTIDSLLVNEKSIRAAIEDYLTKQGILFVDVLDPLRKALLEKTIYPTNEDGHPNDEGYKIIAKAVQSFLIEGNILH